MFPDCVTSPAVQSPLRAARWPAVFHQRPLAPVSQGLQLRLPCAPTSVRSCQCDRTVEGAARQMSSAICPWKRFTEKQGQHIVGFVLCSTRRIYIDKVCHTRLALIRTCIASAGWFRASLVSVWHCERSAWWQNSQCSRRARCLSVSALTCRAMFCQAGTVEDENVALERDRFHVICLSL